MPRKPASPKTGTAKKTTRKKKAAAEAVSETTPITAAEVVESVAETAVVDAPAVKAPTKKRGRKPAAKKAEAVAEKAPVIAEPTAETVTGATVAETPVKKTRKPRAKKADKKAEPVLITTLQIGDAEFDISDIAAKAYKAYKSTHKRKVVTEFHVYVKPEENAAYYTVNGEGSADFKIEL